MLAMTRFARVLLLVVAVIGAAAADARAQADSPCGSTAGGFTDWLNVRLCELARASVPADDQAEAPAATSGSTTLVEKATAPDIFSLALGLVNVGSNLGEEERATSMTVSAFALRSSVTGDNPMNPAVYDRYRNWRRWSFSVGRAEAEEGAPEGRVLGVKALLIDQRDVSDGANDAKFAALTTSLSAEGNIVAMAMTKAQDFIARSLPDLSQGLSGTAFAAKQLGLGSYEATLAMLTEEQRGELDLLLADFVDQLITAGKDVDAVIEQIRRAPQLAVTYHAVVRDDEADDEHHFGVAFDVRVGSRFSATTNGTFVKTDHKLLTDTTVAKVAGELQFDLQRVTSLGDLAKRRGRDPMTVSVAGVGEWYSDDGPTIAKLQVKFTLPLPGIVAGLKIPVSVSFANRTELIDEKDVRGQVGFTVVLSKIQKSLGALRGR
jgi:hypothetical protein